MVSSSGRRAVAVAACSRPETHQPCRPAAPIGADSTRALYAQDVEAIEATVRALEHKLRDIKLYVAREAAAIPQVEAVVAACKLQQQHLQHIAGHLPAYLPSLRSPEVPAGSGAAGTAGQASRGIGVKENSGAAPNQATARGGGSAADGGGSKKRPPAPRRCVLRLCGCLPLLAWLGNAWLKGGWEVGQGGEVERRVH